MATTIETPATVERRGEFVELLEDDSQRLNLGRSVRVVGHVEMRDPEEDPHAKNRRGELGKPLYNWIFNTVSNDPISRMSFQTHSSDAKALVTSALGRNSRGRINADRTVVNDAKTMTAHIKRVARFLGADAVGIAPVDPAFFYKGGGRLDDYARDGGERSGGEATPEEMTRRYPYAICCLVAWDYKMGRAHRHRIGDFAYSFSASKSSLVQSNLAAYLRELGYVALQGAVNPMPMAIAAGLGELGRNGLIISERFGARVHPAVILTDLPLVPDKPIDIGVSDFCAICRKCAVTCPTNSISHEGKTEINGVEKYAINWKTCYALRPFWSKVWQFCLTCVTVCPYTKPNTWWHRLAIFSLKTTPRRLRSLVIRPLKWLDDVIWGQVPQDRVQWLGYDSGRLPDVKACTIAGCTCGDHDPETGGQQNVGYYAPLKENTRRFISRG